jgi:hypothetical protein
MASEQLTLCIDQKVPGKQPRQRKPRLEKKNGSLVGVDVNVGLQLFVFDFSRRSNRPHPYLPWVLNTLLLSKALMPSDTLQR